MNAKTVDRVSYIANVLLVLYLIFLMLIIGYGLSTYNSFGIGRIDANQGRQLMENLIKTGDVEKRLAMAVLINFRINIAGWSAIWATSIYGLFLPTLQRAPIHLLGFCANFFTLSLHLWHMAGGDEAMVPRNDPYHKIPIPFDATVAIVNGIAFVMVVLANKKSSREKAD